MKSSFNLSTRGILYFGFCLILALMITIVVISNLSISNLVKVQEEENASYQVSLALADLRANFNRARALVLDMILTKDISKQNQIEKDISVIKTEVDGYMATIDNYFRNFPEDAARLTELKTLLKDYRDNRDKQISLIKQGKLAEASEMGYGIQATLFEQIRGIMFDLGAKEKAFTLKLMADSSKSSSRQSWLILFIGVCALAVTLVLIIWIVVLLRRMTHKLSDGITVLGSSSNEILTTATEVSTGTTETATAVAETTTTIEEVRQTAQLANQKASGVVEIAQNTSLAAQKGKNSVLETIEGMKKISQQMNLIADSVVKLSDKSRIIGDITTTITDLADQSNLLAVNAAIEAAKAGEHGRGFSVVAQEIRSLSDQSKQATLQVREILNDIQKSVNQAVMATEQGAKAVESGNDLAMQSGEVIQILTESVIDATEAAKQIAVSSQQQMAGMDQLVPAMENIRQASEQNAAGTRQTQVAAHNLTELGQKLKEIVRKIKV